MAFQRAAATDQLRTNWLPLRDHTTVPNIDRFANQMMESATSIPTVDRVCRGLSILAVALLAWPVVALSVAWLRAWQLGYYPFVGERGMNGPWDHLPEVNLWVHSAMTVPLLAIPFLVVAAACRPSLARFALGLGGVGIVVLVWETHYWLVD